VGGKLPLRWSSDFHGYRGRWVVYHVLRGYPVLINGTLGRRRLGARPEQACSSARNRHQGARSRRWLGDKLVMQGLDLDVTRGEVWASCGDRYWQIGFDPTISLSGNSADDRDFGSDLDSFAARICRDHRTACVNVQQGACLRVHRQSRTSKCRAASIALSPRLSEALGELKIELAGLDLDAANKIPAHSGEAYPAA